MPWGIEDPYVQTIRAEKRSRNKPQPVGRGPSEKIRVDWYGRRRMHKRSRIENKVHQDKSGGKVTAKTSICQVAQQTGVGFSGWEGIPEGECDVVTRKTGSNNKGLN